MPNSDIYTADSTFQSVATASQTGLIAMNTPATKRIWIVGIRMFVGSASGVAAGNSAVFSLFRLSNTPVGQAQVTVTKNDPAAPNALVGTTVPTLGTGWLTAPTTTGPALAEWEVPQTTGSMWEEFPPLGYEWGVAVSSGVSLLVTSSATQSTQYSGQIIWSE